MQRLKVSPPVKPSEFEWGRDKDLAIKADSTASH